MTSSSVPCQGREGDVATWISGVEGPLIPACFTVLPLTAPQRLTCKMSVGDSILGTMRWLGYTSAKEGHHLSPGLSTRMPLSRGLCSTTPATSGTCAPRYACICVSECGRCHWPNQEPAPPGMPTFV